MPRSKGSDKELLLKELLDQQEASERIQKPHGMSFSFIFFSSDDTKQQNCDPYQLVFELAEFGDKNGFEALWFPERHFHHFGGPYPNPSVLAASVAVKTERIRIRSGSVVLPLHHPIEVVESWSMVDNLSKGRVDLGFASGWNPNDFIISPDTFINHRDVWMKRIPVVQKLWQGETVRFKNALGEDIELRIFPTPVQKMINIWFVISRLEESFRYAGRHGYNVLTMMQGYNFDELKRKINIYKSARIAGGHTNNGRVTLMLHACVHPDDKTTRDVVQKPFSAYIKSALRGHIQVMKEAERPTEDQLTKIINYSYERYYESASLFGNIEKCRSIVEVAMDAGVTEIALLMDFGIPLYFLRDSLGYLLELKKMFD